MWVKLYMSKILDTLQVCVESFVTLSVVQCMYFVLVRFLVTMFVGRGFDGDIIAIFLVCMSKFERSRC